jgi:hypothetical protein
MSRGYVAGRINATIVARLFEGVDAKVTAHNHP